MREKEREREQGVGWFGFDSVFFIEHARKYIQKKERKSAI